MKPAFSLKISPQQQPQRKHNPPLMSFKKHKLPILVTCLLTIYQLIRIIAFINVYGGIEHDGGWMLSISRSLAEYGQYTTLVSTLPDPNAPGGVGVDQKFDIQAEDGRIWFFTGNGIGPASIIPDALVLKIFGTGFWALRAGPLIFYTLFLLLAAYILYQLAGLGAILLFHAYLFFYPHISIFLSYEAMGEVPSMFYILLAYIVFGAVLQKRERRWWHFLGVGLAASLALNAKLITLWSISGIFVWAGMLWIVGGLGDWGIGGLGDWKNGRVEDGKGGEQDSRRSKGRWVSFGALVWLVVGVLLPVALWELVHLVILTGLTDFEMYRQHAAQRLKFILDDGSGVGLQIHSGAEFFWDKFFILSEVAHPQRWVTALIFLAIFLGGLFFLWQWRKQPRKQNLLAPLWLGWLANTAWFVGLAKTGWPRHFWFGLVAAMMLLCVVSVALLRLGDWGMRRLGDEETCPERSRRGGRLKSEPGSPTTDHGLPITNHQLPITNYWPLLTGIALLFFVGWGFLSQPHVRGVFLPDEIVPYWQEQQINHKYGAKLPWIIIPRAAQQEVVTYLAQLPPEATVYYPAHHKAAEITPQVGRVFYPLQRREFVVGHPQDVTIVGPSLISPWMEPVRRETLQALVREDCPAPLVANDYYLICPFPE